MNELDKSFLEKSNFQVGDVIEDSLLGKGIITSAENDVFEAVINSEGHTYEYAMNYGGKVKDLRRLDNLCERRRIKMKR